MFFSSAGNILFLVILLPVFSTFAIREDFTDNWYTVNQIFRKVIIRNQLLLFCEDLSPKS